MELTTLFRSLKKPQAQAEANRFHVAPIPDFPLHRVGKDANGAPVLLIQIANLEGFSRGPISIKHIAVNHDVTCRLERDAEEFSSEGIFTIVRCVSGEPELRDYFLQAIELIIRQIGDTPSRSDVNRSIQRLVELFRSFEEPAQRTVQGLWAELALIKLSSRPEELLAAWHADPNEGFDFADGPNRIEVKSFSSNTRIHSFSFRQAHPGPGINVVIASIRAERSTGGSSIKDLINGLVSSGIGLEMRWKLETVVSQSLGESATTALGIGFDLDRARDSLRFFDIRSVPTIFPPLPPGVLNVRFESMLDESQSLPLSTLRARKSLFSAVCPL